MHFPDELLDVSEFKEPVEKGVSKPEMQMAKQLIASMTSEWKPQQYTDEYREALKHGEEQAGPPAKQKKPTNVVDLISVLKQSIQQTESKSKPGKSAAKTRASRRKKAA
jgi:DNA end-binding protein Ku